MCISNVSTLLSTNGISLPLRDIFGHLKCPQLHRPRLPVNVNIPLCHYFDLFLFNKNLSFGNEQWSRRSKLMCNIKQLK
jgi:hypothetical protein